MLGRNDEGDSLRRVWRRSCQTFFKNRALVEFLCMSKKEKVKAIIDKMTLTARRILWIMDDNNGNVRLQQDHEDALSQGTSRYEW